MCRYNAYYEKCEGSKCPNWEVPQFANSNNYDRQTWANRCCNKGACVIDMTVNGDIHCVLKPRKNDVEND